MFLTEMQSFLTLYDRYVAVTSKGQMLDWKKVKSPAENQIVNYDQLPASISRPALSKLAVLKVNGGLGTTMGNSFRDSTSLQVHIPM